MPTHANSSYLRPRAALRPHRALQTGARKATPQPIERAATQHAHTALALCDADRLDVVLMHASGSNGAVWYTPADKNAVCTLSVVMRSRTETGEARTARMAARNRPPRALLLTRDDPLRDKVRLAPRVRQPEPNL